MVSNEKGYPPGTVGNAVPRGPGRPKDQEKRSAIMSAAVTLFIEHGFDAVRMDDVAAAAKTSKMTVYGHFADKAALFVASVQAKCDELLSELARLGENRGQASLETALTAFGVALMAVILDPRIAMNSHRLIGELVKDRDLARTFYAAGRGHAQDELAKVLEAAAGRGELCIDSACEAASDLLNLWEGDMTQAIALGVRPPLDEAGIQHRVRRGTAVFLRAYRPSDHSG